MQSTSWSNFCKLFVAINDCSCACPLGKENDSLLAMKLFAEDIGALEALATDDSKARASSEVKIFCVDIGTDLKILE